MDNKLELGQLSGLLLEVSEEFHRATSEFGAFHNAHEGWGVIREEYLELEDEIRKKQRDTEAMETEALHLATMAIRFIIDVCR